MKLTKIIYICFSIPVLITIVLTLLVIVYSGRVNKATELRELAIGLNIAVTELDMVSHEYLLYKEDRLEQEWQSRYIAAQVLLQKAAGNHMEETESMPPAFSDLNTWFLALAENNDERERLIESGASQTAVDAIVAQEQILTNNLHLKAKEITANTSQLAETTFSNANRYQAISRNMAIALMGAIATAGTIAALVIVRMITKPLNKLNNYAKNIAEGNYDVRINEISSNEIGNVVSTVKGMVRQLLSTRHKLVISEKLATIGQLASGVAHDLRNPLGVISNSAYLLKLKLSDTDEKGHKYLELMQKAIFQSSNVIEGLLDLARTKEPILEEVDVKALTTELIDTIDIPENVNLTVEQDDAPKMAADASQIERVFNNIINNAFQAMPNGGTLTISSRQNKNTITTKFIDTGKGIEEKHLGKVFEPLFTTRNGTGGSGIGLSISKTIIEAHKGSIKVNSEIDKGTTFTVKLPVYINATKQSNYS